MPDYFDCFKINCSPVSKKECTITAGDTRLTVLTPCLVRVEVSDDGCFCDEPTQAVWFRDFDNPKFTQSVIKNRIVVKTELAEFCYDTKKHRMLYIDLADSRHITDFNSGNLKGTCRTLDGSCGKEPLEDGIVSRNGVAMLNDGKSLVIGEDGLPKLRAHKQSDDYFFAYGNDYISAVRDFFKLTGFAPLIPRFALGNWWSRYKAYTQEEYLTLMNRFIDSKIPITIATVDMDWHWVDVKKRFGKEAAKNSHCNTAKERYFDMMSDGGWTGYSWNTELFPNPQEFLKNLHDDGFKVTLNLHPATGIRFFEDCYNDFAKFMGDDPKEKKHYQFDITDKKFIEAYFSIVHKPLQDMGVDFWWIDWQQGNKTATPGLDPLWALNHYHSLDIARDGKRRPLILSRFAGAGSHRYPLGFSGDTFQNWKVLDFQPYFTSTATNIGYTWWSHDIGGHHYGKKDDELYLRWVQLGVFSPIMRLHSTSNEFMGKEPWKYSKSVETVVSDFMRLRHRMLPYLYTMNYRTHIDGRAICEPMYYEYPDCDEAYDCKNEYSFGSELIVAPITEPKNKNTLLAGTNAWIPEGRYTDIFNNRIYNGPMSVKLFRDDSTIPVLAKEGAIIPLGMNGEDNSYKNPDGLEILIYRGSNSFSMYEDDGETKEFENGKFAFTDFEVAEKDDTVEFYIKPVRGDKTVIPTVRAYTLSFRDIVNANVVVAVNGKEKECKVIKDNGYVSVLLKEIYPEDSVKITLSNTAVLKNTDRREALIELVSKYQLNNNIKPTMFGAYVEGKTNTLKVKKCFREPIEEIEKLL